MQKDIAKNDQRSSGCTLRQKKTRLYLRGALKYFSINQHQSAPISIISISQHLSASIITNQHQSESIRINQNQSASIIINQNQSASSSINHDQSASVSINQHIEQHIQSASINICNCINCIKT